jgi:hypothetical protein
MVFRTGQVSRRSVGRLWILGAGGGAGAVVGAGYFGGWSNSQLVQGATVSVGAGLRGSASAQITNTDVFPLSSGMCR